MPKLDLEPVVRKLDLEVVGKKLDLEPVSGPSSGGLAKQFFIGLGNSAAFNIPEATMGKNFKELESSDPIERIARGTGTAVGFVQPFGLPALLGKVSTKIAAKGLIKVAPKFVKAATSSSKTVQAMTEGATAGALYGALDPTAPIEDKPINILGGITGGAILGGVMQKMPEFVQKMINKQKRVPEQTKAAINEAVAPPKTFLADGTEVNPNSRADLVPSFKRMIPKEGRDLVEELEKRQTEILAADRGVLPAKTQVELSKNIKVDGMFWNELKPGTTSNAETMYAMRINLVERIGGLGEKPTKEAIESLSKDIIKADAVASETARTLGSLNRQQSMAAEQLRFLKEQIDKLDPEAKGAAQKLFKQFKTPGFWDHFLEARTAFLLSSPPTHIRNTVGNSIARLFNAPEKVVASGINSIESWLTGKPKEIYAREGLADYIGMVNGFRPAIQNALKEFQDESFISASRILEAVRFKAAIPGTAGKVIRLPFRALNAMDEFFSTLSHSASLHSQATRQAIKEGANIPNRVSELVSKPSIEMLQKAAQEAEKQTYRAPLGRAGKSVQKAIESFPAGRFIIPFFRTPINLFKWTLDRSPLGVVSQWKALVKGTPEQWAEAGARLAIGQVISAGFAMQTFEGNITGGLSGNKNKREALMRQGVQPYSIKVGDKYISYRNYEPISSWMGMIANAVEISKEERNPLGISAATEIMMETVKLMKDNTFLRGIADTMNAISDPQKYSEIFIRNQVTSLIPAGVGYIARLYDPIIREPNSIPDAIRAKLPGFSKGVPPDLDVWGRPITREGTLMERALLPSGTTTLKPDLTESELLSLEKFPEKIVKGYRSLNLTVKERNEITKVEGGIAKERLDQAVQTQEYQRMEPEEQRQLLNKIILQVRTDVRKTMIDPIIQQRLKKLKTPEEKTEFLERVFNKQITKE